VDGLAVYVEFKTWQRPQEERDIALASESLRRAIDERAKLSTGCEIRLASIPDPNEQKEIVEVLGRLDDSQSGPTEVAVAAGCIRYGGSRRGIAIGYDTSQEMAGKRVARVMMETAMKAHGITDPVLLFLKLYHFDEAGAPLLTVADLFSNDRYAKIAAVAVFPYAAIRVQDGLIGGHELVLNERADARCCLAPEQLTLIVGAGL
jgi:hypothetical protein